MTAATLAKYAVVLLPNAAALSDAQVTAVRDYVRAGGGLVVTGETALCDELGRARRDFALADVLGVSYRGRPSAPVDKPLLDENFARTLDESYWKQRVGVATLTWGVHELLKDTRLQELVPRGSVRFRGPLVKVTEPEKRDEVLVRLKPDGPESVALPGLVVRPFGKGRVVYCAAMLDAAYWSYSYPYQRRLLVRALEWAAREEAPIAVRAPLCVQVSYFTQTVGDKRRLVMHFFNGVNTTAQHGLPSAEVPLREEVLPIHNIEVTFQRNAPKTFVCEPGQRAVTVRQDGAKTTVQLPPLEVHTILVGEG